VLGSPAKKASESRCFAAERGLNMFILKSIFACAGGSDLAALFAAERGSLLLDVMPRSCRRMRLFLASLLTFGLVLASGIAVENASAQPAPASDGNTPSAQQQAEEAAILKQAENVGTAAAAYGTAQFCGSKQEVAEAKETFEQASKELDHMLNLYVVRYDPSVHEAATALNKVSVPEQGRNEARVEAARQNLRDAAKKARDRIKSTLPEGKFDRPTSCAQPGSDKSSTTTVDPSPPPKRKLAFPSPFLPVPPRTSTPQDTPPPSRPTMRGPYPTLAEAPKPFVPYFEFAGIHLETTAYAAWLEQTSVKSSTGFYSGHSDTATMFGGGGAILFDVAHFGSGTAPFGSSTLSIGPAFDVLAVGSTLKYTGTSFGGLVPVTGSGLMTQFDYLFEGKLTAPIGNRWDATLRAGAGGATLFPAGSPLGAGGTSFVGHDTTSIVRIAPGLEHQWNDFVKARLELAFQHTAPTNFMTSLSGERFQRQGDNRVMLGFGLAWGNESARAPTFERTETLVDFGEGYVLHPTPAAHQSVQDALNSGQHVTVTVLINHRDSSAARKAEASKVADKLHDDYGVDLVDIEIKRVDGLRTLKIPRKGEGSVQPSDSPRVTVQMEESHFGR
jgi:hypothetical protein